MPGNRFSRVSMRRARAWAIVAVLACAGAVILGILALASGIARRPATAPLRAATECRAPPQFTAEYGFRGGVIIATNLPDRKGLVLLDPAQPGRGFQHPSWRNAGYLGPFTTDRDGHIYVAPTPRISVADNPPAGASTIWRVDTMTAEMTPFLRVPAAAPISERNPFGILGLAYACETHSLYAATVAGSTPSREVGRIVQIDLTTPQIHSQTEGVDALGLAVLTTPRGTYLVYGSAREPIVAAIPLAPDGAFAGAPRPILDLLLLGATPTERARRFTVAEDHLDITVVPFTFTLSARSDDPQRHLTARYDPATDTWSPAPASPHAPGSPHDSTVPADSRPRT